MRKPIARASKAAFEVDGWTLTQIRFLPDDNRVAETLFCQSNGYQGIRGLLEEKPARQMKQSGTLIAGLYEHEKGITTYSKGKPVLPSEFCRMANGPHYLHMELSLDAELFSCETCETHTRCLDMKTAELSRSALWKTRDGRRTEIRIRRLVSVENAHLAAIEFSVKPLNYEGKLRFQSWLECDVVSSYLGKGFWAGIQTDYEDPGLIRLSARTRNSQLAVQAAAAHSFHASDNHLKTTVCSAADDMRVAAVVELDVQPEKTYTLEKIVWIGSCKVGDEYQLPVPADLPGTTYEQLYQSNLRYYSEIWNQCDVQIEGDPEAQQGIRFCLFQLIQAYRAGLETSVTAKGLTGEGYGLLCFWDSEIYLLPFYVYTQPELARQILMFRHRILPQARDRAILMGYHGAMYPWMTIHGEDNPGAWECVLGEQHVNVAVPYAIAHYVNATDDRAWLADYGAEMIVECARFWASRVCWNARKNHYVINQVTGPDEYMEMINNNCYTNMMTAWTLRYAAKVLETLTAESPDSLNALVEKTKVTQSEWRRWRNIAENMYVPFDEKLGLHPQDDTFLDLDELDVDALPPENFPLEAKWPWPMVLRHQVLKQPDVVLATFLLAEEFPDAQKKANYEFYEPKTSHDSSLSPSIHALMAAELGKARQAYDYFMHAVRLDLDYGDPTDGIHLANAGGAWMAVANGFAGLRLHASEIRFDPAIPSTWTSYSFKLLIKNRQLEIRVSRQEALFTLLQGDALTLKIGGKKVLLEGKFSCPSRVLPVDEQ